MSSTIHITEKTVNNRDVISFSKEYSGEEHEVFCPEEHSTQVLVSLLSVVNAGKEDSERFVLIKKGDLGAVNVEASDAGLVKRDVLVRVAAELFGEEVAGEVEAVVGGNDE